jgi:hypothetical protein
MTFLTLGLPMISGNTHLGFSSPEFPALQTPDPLSIIRGTPVVNIQNDILNSQFNEYAI